MAVIEYSRNVLGLKDANSTEMTDKTSNPVIDLMEDQKNIKNKGGTMRLGSWECSLSKGSLVNRIYDKSLINERHRHRYEFNNSYSDQIFDEYFVIGMSPDGRLPEIVEVKDHPWFIGVQFHPEVVHTPNGLT